MMNPKPEQPKPTEADLRAAKVALAAKGLDAGLDEAFIRRQYGLTVDEVQRERKPKTNGAAAGAAITITGVCESGQAQECAAVGTVGLVSTDTAAAANETRMRRGEVLQFHGRPP